MAEYRSCLRSALLEEPSYVRPRIHAECAALVATTQRTLGLEAGAEFQSRAHLMIRAYEYCEATGTGLVHSRKKCGDSLRGRQTCAYTDRNVVLHCERHRLTAHAHSISKLLRVPARTPKLLRMLARTPAPVTTAEPVMIALKCGASPSSVYTAINAA